MKAEMMIILMGINPTMLNTKPVNLVIPGKVIEYKKSTLPNSMTNGVDNVSAEKQIVFPSSIR